MRSTLLFLFFISCSAQSWAQEIEVYESFDSFEEALVEDDSKVYVVNFWATWCAPCVKELPHFETLTSSYDSSEVQVVLVSIDFKNQFEKRLQPFLKKKNFSSRLIHMSDPKANYWIPKVDESWQGTIPATLFIKKGERVFAEKAYDSYEELNQELETFIQL